MAASEQLLELELMRRAQQRAQLSGLQHRTKLGEVGNCAQFVHLLQAKSLAACKVQAQRLQLGRATERREAEKLIVS